MSLHTPTIKQNGLSSKALVANMIKARKKMAYARSKDYYIINEILEMKEVENKNLL